MKKQTNKSKTQTLLISYPEYSGFFVSRATAPKTKVTAIFVLSETLASKNNKKNLSTTVILCVDKLSKRGTELVRFSLTR